MSRVSQIRDYLAPMAQGPVPYEHVHEIERLLARCWNLLGGFDAGGMDASKPIGRAEDMNWVPPVLQFAIERHGAFVNGSTRAEVQRRHVDLDRAEATLHSFGVRQLRPMDHRLDVKPLAAEIAALIGDRRDDARIKWAARTRVRIVVGEVIPATNQRTTTGRRRRLAAELERLLTPRDWHRRDAGSHLVFERASAEPRPPARPPRLKPA